MLEPYIQSGLVTYRWFPLEDCYTDSGRSKGLFRPYAQSAAGVAALHRMGNRTRFFASFDVDEFFLLYDGRTILQFLNSLGENYDCVAFTPTVVEYCKGVNVTDVEASPLAARKCITGKHQSDVKLIMRPEKMLIFQTHYAVMTQNWKKPHVLGTSLSDGILAHYRGEPTLGVFQNYPSSPFNHFDSYLASHNATGNTTVR
jgi:Glycosyltransferase family 92